MAKKKLTKRVVETTIPSGKRSVLNDSELPGFQCRISASGRKTYYLYYRTTEGRERRPKIGEHGSITTEQARKIAQQWLAAVANGKDPSIQRQDSRHGRTVLDFCVKYMDLHARPKKKAMSAAEDQRVINTVIGPAFGKQKLAEVERRDIISLHCSMSSKPYAANRVLALLSKMFNLAELWGERPQGSNPCMHVDKYREEKRERYLSPAELKALSCALDDFEQEGAISRSVVDAIRLLIVTGCRCGEIMKLRWKYVDLEAGALHLPDSKTGKKTVYLAAPAVALLSKIPRLKDNPYVITGANSNSHLINIRKPWLQIRTRATIHFWKQQVGVAKIIDNFLVENPIVPSIEYIRQSCADLNIELQGGLLDVRLHDLRHTFASFAVGAGQSLPMVGKLLGHSQPQTTARYAHLADDRVKQAVEMIAADLKAAMEGYSES